MSYIVRILDKNNLQIDTFKPGSIVQSKENNQKWTVEKVEQVTRYGGPTTEIRIYVQTGHLGSGWLYPDQVVWPVFPFDIKRNKLLKRIGTLTTIKKKSYDDLF